MTSETTKALASLRDELLVQEARDTIRPHGWELTRAGGNGTPWAAKREYPSGGASYLSAPTYPDLLRQVERRASQTTRSE